MIDGFGSHLNYEFYHYAQGYKIVAKAARKKLDGRVAQKGGVVTVGQIRAKTQKRDNEEVVKAQVALDRAIATENRKVQARKVQAVINAEKKLWEDMFKEAKGVLIARKKFQVNRCNFDRAICRSMGNR